MKTIAIANWKGGTSKTTTSFAVGSGLALRGRRVLMIDLDAQGNLSFLTGANTEGYNALGVLQRPETAKDEIQHTAAGDIIASCPNLARADMLLTATGKEFKLREALETVAADYDFTILDCPPSLGVVTINALTAADGVIIPALADLFSIQGIGQLNSTIEAVRKYTNPGLQIMGILLTKFNGRAVIRKEVAETLKDIAARMGTKVFKSRIRETVAIVEAQVKRKNIFEYSPRSNGAADYTAFIDELLEA